MSKSITSFVRESVSPAAAYKLAPRGDHADSVYLNLNESPYPLSPKAQQVLAGFTRGNRYPDYAQIPLRMAIGKYIDMPVERIAVGAGLDDVFNILTTLFISDGSEVIIHNPTFGMYESFFALHGATIVDVPLGPAPDFAFDADAIINAVTDKTALIIICNPNNPTGSLIPLDQVEKVVASVSCPVGIDEAYAEFAGVDHLHLAEKYANAIILRTLSKFAGLAGYRVGYGVFPEDLVPYVVAATPAFANISGLSADIAVASLRDLDYLKANRDEQVAERDRVTALLNEMPGVIAYPSSTNFVLFKLPGEDSSAVLDALNQRHIYIRRYGTPGWNLADHLRVSIGLPAENDMFLTALENILSEASQ